MDMTTPSRLDILLLITYYLPFIEVAIEQEPKLNQLQAQITALQGQDTELDDVLRVSAAKLKVWGRNTRRQWEMSVWTTASSTNRAASCRWAVSALVAKFCPPWKPRLPRWSLSCEVASQGDKTDPESILRLNDLTAQRQEAASFTKQCS